MDFVISAELLLLLLLYPKVNSKVSTGFHHPSVDTGHLTKQAGWLTGWLTGWLVIAAVAYTDSSISWNFKRKKEEKEKVGKQSELQKAKLVRASASVYCYIIINQFGSIRVELSYCGWEIR